MDSADVKKEIATIDELPLRCYIPQALNLFTKTAAQNLISQGTKLSNCSILN
jgi:hypothetical protein